MIVLSSPVQHTSPCCSREARSVFGSVCGRETQDGPATATGLRLNRGAISRYAPGDPSVWSTHGFVCADMCFITSQEEELLSIPLCTVLSNNHNFHLTGKWYDEKCSEGGYGFICQKPQGKKKFSSACIVNDNGCSLWLCFDDRLKCFCPCSL